MKTKAVIAVLGLASAALALPAAAQQMSWSALYVGGSVGQSKFKDACSGVTAPGGVTCDDKDTSFRGFVGYTFTRNIAVEAGYADLGKVKITIPPFGDGNVGVTAWDVSGIFSWPIEQFGVFGRLGFASVEAKPGGIFTGDSHTKTDLTYGLGGSYDFNKNLGLRLEWQRYKADAGSNNGGESDVDNFSLGVLWRFQ